MDPFWTNIGEAYRMALVTHILIKFLNHQDIMFRPVLYGTSQTTTLPFRQRENSQKGRNKGNTSSYTIAFKHGADTKHDWTGSVPVKYIGSLWLPYVGTYCSISWWEWWAKLSFWKDKPTLGLPLSCTSMGETIQKQGEKRSKLSSYKWCRDYMWECRLRTSIWTRLAHRVDLHIPQWWRRVLKDKSSRKEA